MGWVYINAMSVEQQLTILEGVQKEVGVRIKQELIDNLEILGDECPTIVVGGRQQRGIILTISSGSFATFKAAILEPKGIVVRRGYLSFNQEMNFDSFGGMPDEGEIESQQYREFARIAEKRILDIKDFFRRKQQ